MSLPPARGAALALALLCAASSRAQPAEKNPCAKSDELKTRDRILAAAPENDPSWGKALEKQGIVSKDGSDAAFVAALHEYCSGRSAAAGGAAPAAERRPADTPLVSDLERAGPTVFGPLPVDYGASLRGYAMSGDGPVVTAPGRVTAAASLSADNYLTNQQYPAGAVVQKFENQKAQLDVRYGLAGAPLPTEIGVQVQEVQRDDGVLNGFISGWEHLTAYVSGNPLMINPSRSGPDALHGTIDSVQVDGRNETGPGTIGPRLGDITLDAKTAVLQSLPGSFVPAVAARLAVNLATGGPFTTGSWAGFGLSAQQHVIGRLYANGEVRMTSPLTGGDPRRLPLRGDSIGSTVGLEYLVGAKTSVGVQVDRQSTPYQPTGVGAFDDKYADVTFGLSRMAVVCGKKIAVRFWGKEDFNPSAPTRQDLLAPHGDTDFSAGVKLSANFR